MTETINEAQALLINNIVAEELAVAKKNIESKIEKVTKLAVPDSPFKVGDKVIVSKDAKALDGFNKPTVNVYFGKQIEAEVVAVSDARGNVTVKADFKTQLVAPQFLTAAPKFKDGDRVSGVGAGITRTGELLPKGQDMEYGNERTIKADGGDCYFVTESTLVAAPKPVPVAKWAKRDRVLVNGKAGRLTFVRDYACCGNDELEITLDDGGYALRGRNDVSVESLDDSAFAPVDCFERPAVGEKLTLAVKYGSRAAGQKVTVTQVDRFSDYEGLLITVQPADGSWEYRAFSHRFARTA